MERGFQIRGDTKNPFHLSVGMVVRYGNVFALVRKPDGYVTLPRETMDSLENVERSVQRGAQEELGVGVVVSRFLGSLITSFSRPDGTNIEKTTIYFFCERAGDENASPAPDELEDEVLWVTRDEAIRLLEGCKNDETQIVERAV